MVSKPWTPGLGADLLAPAVNGSGRPRADNHSYTRRAAGTDKLIPDTSGNDSQGPADRARGQRVHPFGVIAALR